MKARAFARTVVGLSLCIISAGCTGDDIYSLEDLWSDVQPGDNPFTPAGTSGNATVVEGESGIPATDNSGDSDDDVSNTTFTKTITVKWSGTGASVTGDEDGFVTTKGGSVTVNNTGSEVILYKLTGSTTNGSFKLYGTKKQGILLDGVSITNPDGAAINNQSGKRTFIMVEGTNTLSDGASAAYSTSGEEDMKAVLFSEGQLVFSGSGTLTVKAENKQGKSGIVSDDYLRFMSGPTVKVTAGSSAGHGMRGKEYVRISGGTLEISTSAATKKGIGSDDYVLVEGGSTTITVSGGVAYDDDGSEYKGSAGIKADNYFGMTGGSLTIKNTGTGGKGISAGDYEFDETSHALSNSYISGGTISITTSGSESNDVSSKGIKIGYKKALSGSGWNAKYTCAGNLLISGGSVSVNCAKSEGIEAKGNLTISGGETYSYSTGDDSVNCQGEMNVTGGFIYANSTRNDAMDSNGNMKLSGGYVLAVTTKGAPEVALDANTEGGYKLYINNGATVVAYGGLENGYSAAQKVYSMSCTAGSWNALHNGSAFIAAFKLPSSISSVAVSAPSLASGYKGVTVGDNTVCNGSWANSGISGGSSVTLGTYSSQGGGPGGGGGWHW